METKEKIYNDLLDDIDYCASLLKKIKIDVREDEWLTVFDIVYLHMEKKKQLEHFFGAVEALIGDAFRKAQYDCIGEKKEHLFTLYNVLSSLHMLTLFYLRYDEVEIIKEEIIKQCSWGKVINIEDYRKKKK